MKNALLQFLLMFLTATVNAQAVSWELSAEPGDQVSNIAAFQSSNYVNCVLSRGAGVTATTGAGAMNASGWFSSTAATTLNDAISGNDYYEFSVNTENCIFFNLNSIKIVLRSSATGPNTATMRCSSDGFTANLGTVTVTTTSTVFTFPESISPNSPAVIYRLYGYGGAAGGGTPSTGGTMRIGSSVVATDNDIELFGSTTLLEVNPIPDITVTTGTVVPVTVFTANVPGAAIDWSRTPEVIGLGATSGSGNIPAFTASNNTGTPITSTVSVHATVGNCTGSDMVFTITVNPAPCDILSVNFLGNPGACNDNGTPNDPGDDFFTQNIQASFINRPATGSLQIVPGGDQIGTYAIPVNQIIGNSHIFTGVQLKADGTPTVITMNFTDDPACSQTQTGPTVQVCSTPPPPCDILNVNFLGNPGSCNDNGTPNDPGDDFFTQNIQASFINRPATGSLQIVPGGDQIGTYAIPVNQIIGNSHIFNGVQLKADGTPTVITMNFTDDPACSQSQTGPTVQPCSTPGPCAVNSILLQNTGPCNDNGTSAPEDDFFTANVVVTFSNPPATGDLEIEPGNDAIGVHTVPVSSLVGSSHTFTNIQFKADGTTTVIAADFTADQSCVRTATAAAVQPCSFLPPVLNCPAAVSVSCMSEVPVANPGSVTESHTCPGTVTIVHFGDVNSNVACINRLTVTRTYQATDQCGKTATCSQQITVHDQTAPAVTCPANLSVSCASQVPAVDLNSVGVSDNCAGGIGISRAFIGDVSSNQTCSNRFVLTRTYRGGDACGNTATCSQTITVHDQTPPALTCPANQTVACASLVPAQNIALVTGLSDNCGGTTPSVSFLGDVIGALTCINRFTVTRSYRAIDACGNSATCSQIITVHDQTPPVFTSVPANTTVDCYLVPGVGVAAASDNCTGGVTVAFLDEVKTNGICPVLYTLTRSWRATDACGNSATASQVISVTDINAPQFIVLPKNQVLECGPDNVAAFQAFLDNQGGGVTEDCSTINFTFEDSPIQSNTYSCGNTFHKNFRFIATDQCGNSAFRDASFTVVDQTPPVFSTPPLSVELECATTEDNGENAFYNWLDSNAGLVAADACGTVILEKVIIGETQGCGKTWSKTYEFRAKDQCDNIAKIKATFAVVDHTPPTVVCPPNDNIYLPCLEKVPAADPTALTVWDCSAVTVALKDTWTNGTGCPDWPMTVAYRYVATDECGNESACEQAFYVEETETPVLISPDTIKLTCVDDIPGPLQLFGSIKNILTGNCVGGFTSISILADSGQPQNGTTYRTYNFTAKNHCGLVTGAHSLTFLATGVCQQLCTASQTSWGDPNGTVGGMNTTAVIEQLIQTYGPPTIGGGYHTVSALDATCVQEMLFGSGNCAFLPPGHFVCPLPASLANPDGSLNNQLAANALAMQLNIWYNLKFNNRDLGVQDLNNLPDCLADYALLKDLGQHTTIQDILDLTNQYLQGYAGNSPEFLAAYLNAALDNLNYFRVDCALNAPCERPLPQIRNVSARQQIAVQLFPNPATDAAELKFWAAQTDQYVLTISDSRGAQFVHKAQAINGLNTIYVSLKSFSPGVYSLQLQGPGTLETLRLVKVAE